MISDEKIVKALENLQAGQNALQADLTGVKSDITAVKSDLTAVKSETGMIPVIQKQLEQHGKKLDNLLGEATYTHAAIKTLDNKIDATKSEVDEIKRRQRPQHAD